MTIGIAGYVITGTKSVFTNMVLIFGVKFLNLFRFDRTPFPLFIVCLICVTKPLDVIFKPSSFPFLNVSISLSFTFIFLVFTWAIGII